MSSSLSGDRYASSSNVNEPGKNSEKHKSYKGCTFGTHLLQTLPKTAAETNVPRMPPLGTSREICMPNSDELTIAIEAPVVGCNESWVSVLTTGEIIRLPTVVTPLTLGASASVIAIFCGRYLGCRWLMESPAKPKQNNGFSCINNINKTAQYIVFRIGCQLREMNFCLSLAKRASQFCLSVLTTTTCFSFDGRG